MSITATVSQILRTNVSSQTLRTQFTYSYSILNEVTLNSEILT
jgi:hypothetical protein